MKKVFIIFLSLFTFIYLTFNVNASALNFVEIEKIEENISNVTHIKANGTITNDKNISTNQNINVLKMGNNVEVVTWSFLSNGKYSLQTTLNIAKNFEQLNPEFEVIAGVNGDYFSTETINSNVIYGNRIIKPSNHQKYQAIEFDTSGYKIKSHKQLNSEDVVSLSVYDNEKSLVFFNQINNLNIFPSGSNQTTVHLNPINYNPDQTNKYFEIKDYVVHNVGNHVYVEGIIKEEIFEFKENVPVLITSNQELIEKLDKNTYIKVQKQIKDINQNSLILGYDGVILENNKVKEFSEMTGQSPTNNTARHPRTGFGFDNEGKIILFTADGRNAGGASGLDLREFSEIMKYYGANEGYNLDGGGSTQAIARFDGELKVVNNPSETPNRRVGNAVLFVRRLNDSSASIKINEKIEIDFSSLSGNAKKIIVKIDGLESEFNITNKITLDLPNKKHFTISIVVLENIDGINKRSLVRNEFIITDYEEETIYPDFKVSHTYINNILKVTITYDDPNRLINNIRVILNKPSMDEPALSANAISRIASFENLEKLENQEIEVNVTFKDKHQIKILYTMENEIKNKKSPIFIIIGSILIIILPIIGIVIYKKRKRIH